MRRKDKDLHGTAYYRRSMRLAGDAGLWWVILALAGVVWLLDRVFDLGL